MASKVVLALSARTNPSLSLRIKIRRKLKKEKDHRDQDLPDQVALSPSLPRQVKKCKQKKNRKRKRNQVHKFESLRRRRRKNPQKETLLTLRGHQVNQQSPTIHRKTLKT